MKIRVTYKHIDSGVRGSCTQDPISLAMEDAGLFHVWASPSGLSWEDSKRTVYHEAISDELLQFMKAFDNGSVVFPFEFTVGE